jgi:hypothetical protein
LHRICRCSADWLMQDDRIEHVCNGGKEWALMMMSSRVTKTDALHSNQSPTPQPSYQISRSTVAITAYLLMLDPLSGPSTQRRLVDSRQTACWLNHSAAVLRLFPDADQTTRMHPNPEPVRDSKRRVRPGHRAPGTYYARVYYLRHASLNIRRSSPV